MDALDAPTVFRQGSPTLGVPVLSVDYRPAGVEWPSAPRQYAPTQTVFDDPRWVPTLARLDALEAALTALQRPWYVRLWHALVGVFHG